MTDRTLSPQSVVVPLEDWQHVIGALKNAKARLPMGAAIGNVSDALSKVEHLQPAPAPSSLAGGEVREKVARIVDPETFALIAHYTGIERFDGLSPAEREPSVFKAYPDLKTARDAAYADADAILAALSPEAPAREPEGGAAWGVAIEAAAKTVERQIPDAAGGPMSHTNTARVFLFDAVKAIRALTPRHEAPAEGAGDAIEARFPELNDDLIRMASTGNTGSLTEWGRFIERLQSALRARSSAPEARSTVSVLAEALHDRMFGVSSLKDPALALAEISDGGGLHEAAHELLRALPPRGSAPEAREGEAVAWASTDAIAVIKNGEPSLVWPSRDGTTPIALYTHPVAPSADKLRIAVEALEPFRKVHDVVRSKPGAYILTGAAGITVSDVRRADQALAVLKAEGAK